MLEGTATFDTEDGQISLVEDEAVRFAPGDFQHGYNETDEPVRAFAFSAPRDPDVGGEEGVIECPECGERDHPDIETTDNARIIRCKACGAEVSRQT